MKRLLTLTTIGLLGLSLNAAYASGAPRKMGCQAVPAATRAAAKKAIPDVTYPFTFKCQHCGMTITIKTADDWAKDCGPCACGATNLDCYKAPKK